MIGSSVVTQCYGPERIMPVSLDVHLLSGKRVSLEVEEDASVESLKQRAQSSLEIGKGRLLNSSGEVLEGAATIKKARLQSGDVLTLHVKQVQLVATNKAETFSGAFAAVLADGSVATWGHPGYGGDSSAVQKLGFLVVPICFFILGSLPSSGKKGTLIIKGLLGNPGSS